MNARTCMPCQVSCRNHYQSWQDTHFLKAESPQKNYRTDTLILVSVIACNQIDSYWLFEYYIYIYIYTMFSWSAESSNVVLSLRSSLQGPRPLCEKDGPDPPCWKGPGPPPNGANITTLGKPPKHSEAWRATKYHITLTERNYSPKGSH